jgi:hypothetical protein
LPQRQHGWLPSGLHPDDATSYREYTTAEYLAGYSGPPPLVHLRRGETLRRCLEPGLADGKTFVFWGRNYMTGGIPGPERSITWVNQPDKMHGSRTGPGYHPGQARFGNAVYVYRPDFASGDYREAVVFENNDHVTLEFYTPYIIAATPPNGKPWGIYEEGCRNGLVVHGKSNCTVGVSVDQGRSWTTCGSLTEGADGIRWPGRLPDGGLDLTDHVKGHRQYFLQFSAGAKELEKAGLTIMTVCQANPSTMPRLKDGGTTIDFAATDRAVVSAGPNLAQARAHVVEGSFGTPRITLELSTPRGEPAVTVYPAAHVLSSNPPSPKVKYQIEVSTDGGKSWRPAVKDWTINRQGDEPKDFWSQSLCWGSLTFDGKAPTSVRVRFRNDGGKAYARAEAHLVYRTAPRDATRVTIAWTDDAGAHESAHSFTAGRGAWQLPTGRNVRTRWVEFAPVAGRKN